MRHPLTISTFTALLPLVAVAYSARNGAPSRHTSTSWLSDQAEPQLKSYSVSRRRILNNAFAAASSVTFGGLALGQPNSASAAVYVDPDRYGDKELKSATVNKLRQTIRDALLKDPRLAPCLLKIAILDALTYNAATTEGGPDGSIVAVILSKDAPSSVSYLTPAAEQLLEMYSKVKRTTETTMADIVAFAGAESIESFGGPRTVVQLGKLDSPKRSAAGTYTDLFAKSTAKEVVLDRFVSAGLNDRDVALLFGAVGAMEQVLDSLQEEEEEPEEENEMGDKAVFIPSSFGAPSEIYGKNIGSMDNSVFVQALSDIKGKKQTTYDVFRDDSVAKWITKYADKKGGFLKDLPYAYGRLTALGTTYTGGKIGNLLGSSDE